MSDRHINIMTGDKTMIMKVQYRSLVTGGEHIETYEVAGINDPEFKEQKRAFCEAYNVYIEREVQL